MKIALYYNKKRKSLYNNSVVEVLNEVKNSLYRSKVISGFNQGKIIYAKSENLKFLQKGENHEKGK